jgi:hypothetical protein
MSKDVLDKIELMIETINKIHADFSQDYFETGRIEKFNLSKMISPCTVLTYCKISSKFTRKY